MSPQSVPSPATRWNSSSQLVINLLSFIAPLAVVSGLSVAAVIGIAAIKDATTVDLFPTDRVLDVQITLAEEDWNMIRLQSRDFFDALPESRKFQPVKRPYTLVTAKLTIDGLEFPEVGIRKKGFIGSQNRNRPSLKIKLDHVDKSAQVGGLRALTFNNNNQDTSQMSQFMGYAFFNRAGSPACRCALARVTVNGKNLGIYSHVETVNKPLLRRGFGDDRGTLYEGTVTDFHEGWEGSFEKKVGKDRLGRPKIEQLIRVLQGEVSGDTILGSETIGRARVPTGKSSPELAGLADYRFSEGTGSQAVQEIETRITSLKKTLSTMTPALAEARAKWESDDRLKRVTLNPWSVIGPFQAVDFDAAYKQAFPPEVKVDPTTTYSRDGKPNRDGKIKWTRSKRLADGRPIPLSPQPNSATYLFRTIESPTARKLTVALGSDDSLKLWTNGELVAERKVHRGVTPNQDMVEVKLVAGENRILMKIVNGGGASGYYFRAVQPPLPPPVFTALKITAGRRTDQQKQVLDKFFLAITPLLQSVRDQLVTAMDEHSSLWTAADFDDSGWTPGQNGAGYEKGEGYESLISKPFNFLVKMHQKNASVLLRFPFELDDPSALVGEGDLLLRMKYDDGFVAYLNGHRVASANAPKLLRWNSRATAGHDDPAAMQFESFNISDHRDKLRSGTNVLAIHGLNVNPESTDMLIAAEIRTSDLNMEQAIGKLVDLDAFYRFWAIEGLLGFWDGYSANRNNFFVYLNPYSGKFHFMPWGTDCLFEKFSKLRVDPRAPLSVKTMGLVAHKLYQVPAARERYRRTLRDIMDKHWDEEALLAETHRIEAMIQPGDLSEPQKRAMPGKLKGFREFIRNRRADIEKEIADGMPIWTAAPSPPPQLKRPARPRQPPRRPPNPGNRPDGKTIWTAAKTGHLEALKRHLANGVDVNVRGDEKITPLFLATLAGKIKTMDFLLSKGAELNARTEDGSTVLHWAAVVGRVGVVKFLLDKGANVNARNKDKETPLELASKPWTPEFEQGVRGFLHEEHGIRIPIGQLKASRPRVAAMLRERVGKRGIKPAKPVDEAAPSSTKK